MGSKAQTRTMMRAKIHRITVTQADLHYEGSLTLDTDLMEQADMVPYERVDVYNVDNGNRFATYLIEGEPGSGVCCANGAAARLVQPGDKLILVSYAEVANEDIADHEPTVVLLGEGNRVVSKKQAEAAGVRVNF
jgi:aspartate 1-decarboxylase